MKFTKENLKPVIVLTAICLVSALLLAAVNMLTKDVIKDNEFKRQQASLTEAMKDNNGFAALDYAPAEGSAVTAVYKENDGRGYVFLLSTRSQYTGSEMMGITVGVDMDGKIVGVVLTSYSESKDFGKKTYPGSYVEMDAAGVDGAATVAGVTYSSTAFKNAMKDAMTAFADLTR